MRHSQHGLNAGTVGEGGGSTPDAYRPLPPNRSPTSILAFDGAPSPTPTLNFQPNLWTPLSRRRSLAMMFLSCVVSHDVDLQAKARLSQNETVAE